ncbi:single-stranded DNA-binding protein [Streptomyces sp. NPDC090026]|uniref:single-stranded DNA-binding protein n=1 Tax=Streptomyces sp. NPDC090026 TaxID=3365923 RepID=UPI0037F9916A
MALPSITGTGRLTADPELRFTSSGKAVASVPLAFNSRRKNDRGEWEDGDTFYVRGTVWERLAENVAESLAKGMEVLVSGELRTESWEKDGQKYERPALLIRSIGPGLAFAVAAVSKDAGGQQQSSGRAAAAGPARGQTQRSRPSAPPQDDPWATGTGDEPPF